MQTKSLQFGRALSAALFVLLLSVVGMKNALGQNQVAILQHNDSIAAFYGADAFKQANAAAADGDTITLSSGNFNGGVTISKAITLHGAGMVADTFGITPTKINGTIYLNVSNDSEYLTIEGIYFSGTTYVNYGYSLRHAVFNKCYFSHFDNSQNANSLLFDVVFYNCLIENCQVRSAVDGVVFYNCVLDWFRNYAQSGTPSVYFYNSIITNPGGNVAVTDVFLYNCIIGGRVSNIQSQYANHCIEISDSFPSTVSTFDCMTVNSYEDVFENWDGTVSIDANYALRADVAHSFLGNDGSQVGIYGGAMPFNPRPSYLRPYRCNVPGYTTIDGHLNVEVEVAPEE
jgi:hypothetical protein